MKNVCEIENFLRNSKEYNIVLFGASNLLEQYINKINSFNFAIDCICDNDKRKHNTYKYNLLIIDPNIKFKENKKFIIIVTSSFFSEIKKQSQKFNNIIQILYVKKLDFIFFTPDNFLNTNLVSKKYLDFFSYVNYEYVLKEKYTSKPKSTKYNLNENSFALFVEYNIFQNYTETKKEINLLQEPYQTIANEVINKFDNKKSLLFLNNIKQTSHLQINQAQIARSTQ
jgi:hypothetical protein